MVPSWTETLLECGCEVVGRTRFCIHPERVRDIPIVGGTKSIDWDKVGALNADLLLLDREENTRSMSVGSPIEVFATHVTSVDDVARELERLFVRLGQPALRELAGRWAQVGARPEGTLASWQDLPGVIEWLRPPQDPSVGRFAYLIWRDPWMAIGPGTFIASMLTAVGLSAANMFPRDAGEKNQKYPVTDPAVLPGDAVLLASSEPYPFHRKREALLELGRPVAIVDGESFSWFGLRSLSFLEGVAVK
jgi:hypothetical protein